MKNPVVSIITPSYNRADIVHETALSIFNQTYPHWEWVIVDDGSTDNSWEVLQSFAAKDERVKIFKRDREPKGACQCRNTAIEKSTGDYLIFLDTDDLMATFCLEQRVKAMQENPTCDFIIFPMLLFKKQPDDLKLLWNIETGEDDLLRILKGDPICQGTGTLWKKDSFESIGLWNIELKLWQDIELHIRSILNDLHYIKKMDLLPDVFLRISEVSLSRTGFHSLQKLQSRGKVFTYALEKLIEKNKHLHYKAGLRAMANEIIYSAIRSRHFEVAEKLIQVCKSNTIFNSVELKKINNLKNIYKIRLYKIPFASKFYEEKVLQIIPAVNSTISKIKWSNPVQL